MAMRAARVVAVVVGILALVVAGCGGATGAPGKAASLPAFPADSYMAKIQQRGNLIVGVKYDTPPFGFMNPTTSQVEGFDADLAREMAKALFGDEKKVQFVEAVSRNRIPFLQEDKVDVILSTMTITEERRREIDFSDTYYMAGQSILVKKGSPIKGVEDLNGRTVSSAQGSTSEQNVRERAPGANLLLFPAYAEALAAMKDGRADAMSTDDTILMGMILRDADLQMVGGLFTEEPYGAGIKKGRPEFLAFMNKVFDDAKANGRWTELYKKHVAPLSGFVAEPPR
jgi:aspartate/glutamate/glutamine transport system substrate-binding protein